MAEVVSTSYQTKMIELMDGLIQHGYGEIVFKITTLKTEEKARIQIECGKHYVYIIHKQIPLKDKYLL